MHSRPHSVVLALVACLCAPACTEVVTDLPEAGWPDPNDYPELGNGKILVTNNGDDTVTWIDLDSLDPVFVEPVGRVPAEREGPHHGAAALDASAYYVGLSNFVHDSGSGPHGTHGAGNVPGYLLAFDATSHLPLGVVELDRNPADVRLTPDGRYLLASHADQQLIAEVTAAGGSIEEMKATVAIIDPTLVGSGGITAGVVAKPKVCPSPQGLAPAADSASVYVACQGSDELAIVSLTPPYEVRTFHIGTDPVEPTAPYRAPYALMVSPADGAVWVTTLGRTGPTGTDVRVFDPVTETWDETRGPVVTGGFPHFGAFTADGSRLIVPSQTPNTLSFIDAATGTITTTLPLPGEACLNPHLVLLTPDETRAVVVCEGNHLASAPGSVVIVDLTPAEPAVLKWYPAGVRPDGAFLLGGTP